MRFSTSCTYIKNIIDLANFGIGRIEYQNSKCGVFFAVISYRTDPIEINFVTEKPRLFK